MSKQLTVAERAIIIGLFQGGKSQVEIAKKTKVSESTVSRTIKKYAKTNTLQHLRGNGRPEVISIKDSKILDGLISKNPNTSLRKMSSELMNKGGTRLSYSTVKRHLNKKQIFAFSPIKKPLLKDNHKKVRFEHSKNFMFMENEEIKRIIFSDESKFNLFYSDGKVSVWREKGTGLFEKNLSPTVKHGGGSIMVWGCFSYYGVGKLVLIEGKMDSRKYVNILAENLPHSARSMGLDEYIFQQDNDPKHTSKLTKEYFEKKNINVISWPSQSPDMNPIETLWAIVKGKLTEFRARNLKELRDKIEDVWNSISDETCKKLAMSFRERANAVYIAKGGHTKF
ncbi:Transposable element Tcb1 transposase [Dictyocoela roeselum]|nr:Transposable element Tcb1 transposase [Dictyocoela roeselum]